PRVDILASEAQVVLEIELPGVRKEDITARVDDEGSSVTIEGTYPERAEGELKRVYGERRTEAGAAFSRTIPLPGAVDKESVRAKLADGVLTITLAKVQVEEPQGTPV
ncbi:HSP20-like chaperone, partial [Peniophora sp. CONT]